MLVTVLDVNDVVPVFDWPRYSVTLPENTSVDSRVLLLHAADRDSGQAGHVTYSIVSGDGVDHFRVDADSGSLTLVTSLDYETKTSYS